MINKILWLSLDHETRQAIAKDFGMAKTEPTEVVDNKVVSDGYSDKSLMMITEEKLDEKLLRTQSVLPQGFMKKWEYYVADIRMSLGKEDIKYSDNEGLNDAIKNEAERISYEDKNIADGLNNPMTAEHTLSEEIGVIPPKTKQPKKMGRPKGSKKK